MGNDRCPKCGDYRFDNDDICRNCGYSIPKSKSPSWWGQSDFHGSIKSVLRPGISDTPLEVPELKICTKCGEKSLFWNKYSIQYECLNRSCGKILCPFCNIVALEYSDCYVCPKCRRKKEKEV